MSLEAFTTVSVDIFSFGVVKFLQTYLEHPLGPRVTGACDGEHGHGPHGHQCAPHHVRDLSPSLRLSDNCKNKKTQLISACL